MRYTLLLIGLLCLKSVTSYATDEYKYPVAVLDAAESLQNPEGNDIVYLKDGSVIYGTITFYDATESLTIKSNDGIDFEFPIDKVLRMEKGISSSMRKALKKRPSRDSKSSRGVSRGYQGYFDLGQNYDVGGDSSTITEFLTSHGFRFNPYIFLGGGVGLHYYSVTEEFYIPMFTNFRVDFLNKRISPYFDLKVGSLVNNGGGLFLSPSLGVKFNFGKRVGLNLSVNYNFQALEDVYIDNSWSYYNDDSYYIHAIGFRIGLEF